MNVRVGKSDKLGVGPGTYSGLLIYAILTHGTANTAIANTDFLPQAIDARLTINKRGGRSIQVFGTNLLNLGVYFGLQKGMNEFITGNVRTYAAGGVFEIRHFPIFIEFGSLIKVENGEEGEVEINFGSAGQSSNISSASEIVFKMVEGVGNPVGIPSLGVRTIQAGLNTDNIPLGDMVSRIAIMNFDKTSWVTPVMSNWSLRSDKLTRSMNFDETMNADSQVFGNYPMKRYGSAPPTASVIEFSKYLPQNFLIFTNQIAGSELNRASLNVNYNSAQVASSANVVMWENILTDRAAVKESVRRKVKHDEENVNALPADGVVSPIGANMVV